MPDFGGGYQNDRAAGGSGFGSSGSGGPGGGRNDFSGGSSEKNTAWGYDQRTGRKVQVGKPSLTGRGMMTTGVGGQAAFHTAMRNGNMGQAWKAMTMSNKASPFHNQYRQNLQKNIRDNFAAKRSAEALDRATLAKQAKMGAISPFDHIMATKAAYKGDLNELEGFLGQPSAMRKTHNSGGLLGNMFGVNGDDVQTSFEDRDALQAGGQLDSQGKTSGFGPMNPAGYLMSITSAPVAGMMAKGTYGLTGNVPMAKAIGRVAQMGLDTFGKQAQPSAFSAPVSMGLGMLGVPAVSQLGQMAKVMDTGLTLNSYGITNPNPTPSYRERSGNHTRKPWWSSGGFLT